MSEADAPASLPSRPERLREAREAAGLHIAALAAALKVPVRKLELLEAGRYDALPDLTFARALASSACRHLRIDPAPVLAQIPVSPAPQLVPPSPVGVGSYRADGEAPRAHPAGWLSRPAVLAAIALLLGALVLVFLPRAATPPTPAAVVEPAPAPAQPPIAPALVSAEPAPPVMSAPTAAPPGAEPAVSAPATPAAPEAAAAPSATPASPATPPPPPAPASASALLPPSGQPNPVSPSAAPGASNAPAASAAAVLRIEATGETWVEVSRAGGVPTQRLLRAGDHLEFSDPAPYGVVIGRAEAARVTVRGQPFDAAALARNSVARFEVK